MKKLFPLLKLSNKAVVCTNKTVCITPDGDLIQTDLSTFLRIQGISPQIPDLKPGVYDQKGFEKGIYNKVDEADNFPQIPDNETYVTFSINSDELKRASEFCGKDVFRPAFDYVSIKNGYIYSTNANMLRKNKIDAPNEAQVGIHKDVIKILPKGLDINVHAGQKEYSKIEFDFIGYKIQLYFKNCPERFPDFDQVIPDSKRSGSFKIPVDQILWDKFLYVSKNIQFKNTKDYFIIRSEDIDKNTEFEQKGVIVESTQDEFDISFNTEFLKKCAGKSKTAEVLFDIDKPNRPANIVTDGEEIVIYLG